MNALTLEGRTKTIVELMKQTSLPLFPELQTNCDLDITLYIAINGVERKKLDENMKHFLSFPEHAFHIINLGDKLWEYLNNPNYQKLIDGQVSALKKYDPTALAKAFGKMMDPAMPLVSTFIGVQPYKR